MLYGFSKICVCMSCAIILRITTQTKKAPVRAQWSARAVSSSGYSCAFETYDVVDG